MDYRPPHLVRAYVASHHESVQNLNRMPTPVQYGGQVLQICDLYVFSGFNDESHPVVGNYNVNMKQLSILFYSRVEFEKCNELILKQKVQVYFKYIQMFIFVRILHLFELTYIELKV